MQWRESEGVEWLEAEMSAARVAFSGRRGGVSVGEFAELNLGLLTEDEPAAVGENRLRLCAALGLSADRVGFGRQVHGADLLEHTDAPEPGGFGEPGSLDPREVDGHHTSSPGVALLVFVADCLPIALSGPGGVAMVHGGWRGLAAGIVGRGAAAVGATEAVVGPGIGPCCFEVGEEVIAAFSPLGDGLAQGRMLDLFEVAARLLERAGVERIELSRLCTRCNPELLFSHRGQGPRTGRQAGLVWLAEGE